MHCKYRFPQRFLGEGKAVSGGFVFLLPPGEGSSLSIPLAKFPRGWHRAGVLLPFLLYQYDARVALKMQSPSEKIRWKSEPPCCISAPGAGLYGGDIPSAPPGYLGLSMPLATGDKNKTSIRRSKRGLSCQHLNTWEFCCLGRGGRQLCLQPTEIALPICGGL